MTTLPITTENGKTALEVTAFPACAVCGTTMQTKSGHRRCKRCDGYKLRNEQYIMSDAQERREERRALGGQD